MCRNFGVNDTGYRYDWVRLWLVARLPVAFEQCVTGFPLGDAGTRRFAPGQAVICPRCGDVPKCQQFATVDYSSHLFPDALEAMAKGDVTGPFLGASRNSEPGPKSLEKIEIPIPDYDKRLCFNRLQAQAVAITQAQTRNQTELGTLFPGILDRAVKGEL